MGMTSLKIDSKLKTGWFFLLYCQMWIYLSPGVPQKTVIYLWWCTKSRMLKNQFSEDDQAQDNRLTDWERKPALQCHWMRLKVYGILVDLRCEYFLTLADNFPMVNCVINTFSKRIWRGRINVWVKAVFVTFKHFLMFDKSQVWTIKFNNILIWQIITI